MHVCVHLSFLFYPVSISPPNEGISLPQAKGRGRRENVTSLAQAALTVYCLVLSCANKHIPFLNPPKPYTAALPTYRSSEWHSRHTTTAFTLLPLQCT